MSALITNFSRSRKTVSYVSYSYQWVPRVMVPGIEGQDPVEREVSTQSLTDHEESFESSGERDDVITDMVPTRLSRPSTSMKMGKDQPDIMSFSAWFPKIGSPPGSHDSPISRSGTPSPNPVPTPASAATWGIATSKKKRRQVSESRSSTSQRPSTSGGSVFSRNRRDLDLGLRGPSVRGKAVASNGTGSLKLVDSQLSLPSRSCTPSTLRSVNASKSGQSYAGSLSEGSADSIWQDLNLKAPGAGLWESLDPSRSEILSKARMQADPVRPPLPENAVLAKWSTSSKMQMHRPGREEVQKARVPSADRRTRFQTGHPLLTRPSIANLNDETMLTLPSSLRNRRVSTVSDDSTDKLLDAEPSGSPLPIRRTAGLGLAYSSSPSALPAPTRVVGGRARSGNQLRKPERGKPEGKEEMPTLAGHLSLEESLLPW
mmetsp:Transcript_10457/g.20929  ORF Transcript_10457/g.20929 Transcript_10457/m.20929 type:complete len:431 (-) Transcript_10457:209-1501(-)|eukprot:CAMPEP_0181300928 /NCGR_PEP_ID=MMETSP1101-20121128/7153_1 /TAXON_ID=46948 /ORGANISM="Rhodomonas abbreviata, Strain Caron Lab Isolate" /LENGTH=430 /DNA_ID=CAMNT_0023406201 /DNA_START=265 /DNA_END=1557 /DNA_ORIENTATION=-